MSKKIRAKCFICDTVGYIPEDYQGKIKCPKCESTFQRTGIPLSVTRKQLLNRLDQYEDEGFIRKVKWITAGDDHVCEECRKKEGVVYTIGEMRKVLFSDFCTSDQFEQGCRCVFVMHREKESK